MSAVKNHYHDLICADASFCPVCEEPEMDPSVEAFEVFGEVMCADCACQLFEDSGKTHILTAMRGE